MASTALQVIPTHLPGFCTRTDLAGIALIHFPAEKYAAAEEMVIHSRKLWKTLLEVPTEQQCKTLPHL